MGMLEKLVHKKTLRVAGLMSGTSVDGIDVAIVDISPSGVRVSAFDMFPYGGELRKRIFRLFDPKTAGVDEICHMNFVLGEVFARSLVRLAKRSGIPLRSIDLVGSHGQTVWHEPVARGAGGGVRTRSTLQIAEPSVIAERTGITTVADFRPGDIAAGGQGAPLVPFADLVLFGHPTRPRALQNIGGIANVTYLPPMGKGSAAKGRGKAALLLAGAGMEGAIGRMLAFDTGPGNMIIDRLTWLVTGGRKSFDRGGKMAGRGRVDKSLLAELMRHGYFRRRPPKTTGREMFGASYSDEVYARAAKAGIGPDDLLATATAFTALSIAQAYRRFLPAEAWKGGENALEVILCGGGARNATLVAMLGRELAPLRVAPMDEWGIDADAKEAVSFAILAYATVHGVCGNVPAATGASRRAVLGKIVPGR